MSDSTGNSAERLPQVKRSPYRPSIVRKYNEAGWTDVLPVIPEAEADVGVKLTKKKPPSGFTGHAARHPTQEDHDRWEQRIGLDNGGIANVYLHMPKTVVTVDVDQYGPKLGAQELAELEAELGTLPATYRNTARGADLGTGGQLPFRITEEQAGLKWDGKVKLKSTGRKSTGLDVLSFGYRYALVWPSRNPSTEGAMYRWYRPDGSLLPSGEVPRVDALPYLPEAWVSWLTGGGQLRAELTEAALTATDVREWIISRSDHDGDPCSGMRRSIESTTEDLSGGHPAVSDGLWELLSLANEGHEGISTALAEIQQAWLAEIQAEDSGHTPRDLKSFHDEWRRMVEGAVRKIVGSSGAKADDECYCSYAAGWGERQAKLMAGGGDEDGDNESSSWAEVDISDILDGTYQEVTPEILVREDGRALFYRGLVHWLYGESESGKSWIAKIAATQVLATGGRVVYVDFESRAATVVGRLLMLGVDRELLRPAHGLFKYVRPHESVLSKGSSARSRADLEHHLSEAADYVVMDGITDAFALEGVNSDSGDDVVPWIRRLPRRFAEHTGAAVVCVDHVKKDKESRGRFAIGSQSKMATIDGAAFLVEPEGVIAQGKVGVISMRVTKDREGSVRAYAGEWSSENRTQEAARIELDSRVEGVVSAKVGVPSFEQKASKRDSENALNGRIVQKIKDNPGITKGNIVKEVNGKNTLISEAIDNLKRMEVLRVEEFYRGGNASQRHYFNEESSWGTDAWLSFIDGDSDE